jgi:hypothetical protein
MNTVNSTELSEMGCEISLHDNNLPGTPNSIIILDFGYPYYQNGMYGTKLFQTYAFASTSAIGNAIEYFAYGYDQCSDGSSLIKIAIGTSNCGLSYCSGSEVTYAHGAAWADMVYETDRFLYNNEYKMTAVGAVDIEIAWNTPNITKDWVNGFTSRDYVMFYDYGDAQGCPMTYPPPYGDQYCDNGWYQEDVWFVSFGSGVSKPLPLIYADGGENADQWYSLSAYAFYIQGTRMDIKGSVTQYQACQQVGIGDCEEVHMDNTPMQGYYQLLVSLLQDPNTAQSLSWATDMKWKE